MQSLILLLHNHNFHFTSTPLDSLICCVCLHSAGDKTTFHCYYRHHVSFIILRGLRHLSKILLNLMENFYGKNKMHMGIWKNIRQQILLTSSMRSSVLHEGGDYLIKFFNTWISSFCLHQFTWRRREFDERTYRISLLKEWIM